MSACAHGLTSTTTHWGRPLPRCPPTAAKPANTYCFPAKVEKIDTAPKCPSGYAYSHKLSACFKYGNATCSHKTVMVKSAHGAKACAKCARGFEWCSETGQCEKPCAKGYKEVTVSGVKYCVQLCKGGLTPKGQ